MSKKVPMPKRNKLEDQVASIMKLLIVWPTATHEAIEKYVKDTSGSVATRVCIQQAKEELGLHQPEHEELTIKKMHFTKMVTVQLCMHHGIGGLKEATLISQVSKALKNEFEQATNHHLVTGWVKDVLTELAGTSITKYAEVHARIRKELIGLGVVKEVRQHSLLD